MNNISKKIIAIAAVCCAAFSAVTACSSNEQNSSNKNSGSNDPVGQIPIEYVTDEAGNNIGAPLQVGTAAGGNDISGNNNQLGADDNTSPAEPATEYVTVTDSNNQPVTQYVPVTEDGGEIVTEAGGQQVTEAVPVTTVVEVTDSQVAEYTPGSDSRYMFWLDISENKDYLFEGQFIKLTFKVNENVPNGDYAVNLRTDLSTVGGKSLNASTKKINGAVRVGGSINEQDVSSETGLTVYGDNVSCDPGDTIDYYVNIKNNPGIAAFLIWVDYDPNALEYQGYSPAGDFVDVAARLQTGTSPQAQ